MDDAAGAKASLSSELSSKKGSCCGPLTVCLGGEGFLNERSFSVEGRTIDSETSLWSRASIDGNSIDGIISGIRRDRYSLSSDRSCCEGVMSPNSPSW